jgi:hypothetical protein
MSGRRRARMNAFDKSDAAFARIDEHEVSPRTKCEQIVSERSELIF